MNHNEVAKRIWQKDATLWKSDPENVKIISNAYHLVGNSQPAE